jgi:hypothetical protein
MRKRRPSEIGGILLRTASSDGDEISVVITDVKFIESEGKLFNSTVYDLRALQKALQVQAKTAVGYFRSHIRDGLCLSEQDAAFVEWHLNKPDQICLLVRPFDFGVCMAGFFLWDNGRLQTDFTDFEVSLFAPQSQEGPPAKIGTDCIAEAVELATAEEEQPASRSTIPPYPESRARANQPVLEP